MQVTVCNKGIYSNSSAGCCSAQRLIHMAAGNMCATHGEAWTEWEPQAGEAHRDLHTNNHHTSLTDAHMDPCSPLLQEVEVSHYDFSSQVVLSVCDWDMVMRNIRCGASMWKCLKTPRDLRELITANYRNEAQQLELPKCHSKTGSAPLAHQWPPGFTGTETSSVLAPHPSFLWLHDSWQGQIYTSEKLQDYWELVGINISWPRHRLLRLLFQLWGFPPCCGIVGILKMLAARCLKDKEKDGGRERGSL